MHDRTILPGFALVFSAWGIVRIHSISHNPPDVITGEEWELSFFTYFFFS